MTLAATIAPDKKLPQINLIRLFSVKSISDNVTSLLKNHATILARKETSHPFLKLRQCHKAVPMPLILNQLMIHLRQQPAIIQGGSSVFHGRSERSFFIGILKS